MEKKPFIIFRTEGDLKVGFGHIRRCLSLAEALRRAGNECLFILQGTPAVGHIVQTAGFQCTFIPPGEEGLIETVHKVKSFQVESIVIDSYTLSREYFLGLLASGIKLVAINDLPDRDLPANMVVNGSIGAEVLNYHALDGAKYLLGTKYVLLRPEFASRIKRRYSADIRSVLITVGGSDPYNLTPLLMRCVNSVLGNIRTDVLIGPLFNNVEQIAAEARNLDGQIILHENPENIHSIMLSADLAICGGGQTTYELAATGTPALGLRVANNQSTNLMGLAAANVLVWVGDATDRNLEKKVCREIEVAKDKTHRKIMGNNGKRLVDGLGAIRVAKNIIEL